MSERKFELNISPADHPRHVIAWLIACRDGGLPWLGSASELNALSAAINNGSPADDLVGADQYWIIRKTRGWKQKFYAALSPPGDDGIAGSKAWKELRTPSRHHELRLLQVGSNDNVQFLATFLTQEGIYFLCPKTGLFYWSVEQSRAQFEAHMDENYAAESGDDFRAWIVPLPTLVHVTWIGPESPNQGSLPDDAPLKDLRKDVAAARKLSRALRSHLVFFHCLKKYKLSFAQLFPAATYPNVRVVAVEDQLSEAGDKNLRLAVPELDSLDRSVGYVFRRSLELQSQTGPKRDIVNAKNMWSLYAIWRYGGYHMDSGVFPHRNGTKLPEPDEFGLARNRRQSGSGHGQDGHSNAGRELRLVQLDAGRVQKPFNAVLTDSQNTFKQLVFPPRKSFREHLQARFAADLVVLGEVSTKIPNADVDVWLMGSNPMNPIVRRAIVFYVQEWFVLQRLRREGLLDEVMYGSACRAAIISAVYTGMAPVNDDNKFWGGPRDFFDRFGYDFDNRIVLDFGLEKIFYGTH